MSPPLARYSIVAPMLTGKTTAIREGLMSPFKWRKGAVIDVDDLYDHQALKKSTGLKPGPALSPEQWATWEAARVEAGLVGLKKFPEGRVLLVQNPSFGAAMGFAPIMVVLIDEATFKQRQAKEPDRAELAAFNRSLAEKYAREYRLPITSSLTNAIAVALTRSLLYPLFNPQERGEQ